MQNVLKITLWNVEWATPQTRRGSLVSAALEQTNPSLICVTEGFPGIFPIDGHLITSAQDYAYGATGERRKVLLWSQQPWSDVDSVGSPLMPSGRFVSGITQTSLGPLRCVAVCIPWRDAHVRTGQKNRTAWEDHLAFLDGLEEWQRRTDREIPTVLLGDFNQRVPRGRQPVHVFERLEEVLCDWFKITTEGDLKGVRAQSIDHIALSPMLQAGALTTFSGIADDGTPLSDHFGLRLEVERQNDERRPNTW